MLSPRFLLCSLPWLAGFCVVAWLTYLHVQPSGRFEVQVPLDGTSSWFYPFEPSDRVSQVGVQAEGWNGQRIYGDPTYASVRVPAAYERVRLSLDFRPVKQPLIEFGARPEGVEGDFDLRPIWSDFLSNGWRTARFDGLQGFVRSDEPDQALTDQNVEHVLTWHASSTSLEKADPQTGSLHSYQVALRGQHDFYILPAAGHIFFHLRLQDMNRTPGQDVLRFRLTRGADTLWTDSYSTGGAVGEPGPLYDKTISFDDLTPGVYRLSLIGGDDFFIRQIETTAVHWVIGPRLYIGDTVGSEVTRVQTEAWTNSLTLMGQTYHATALQDVEFGSARLSLPRTHEPFFSQRQSAERSGAVRVSAPQGDVRLVGDGFFALEPAALFLPLPRRLTDLTDATATDARAVLTPYQAPQSLGDGWYRMTQTYTLPPGSRFLKLALSAPGIEQRGGSIDLRAATLVFERDKLTTKNFLSYLRAELSALRKAL